MIDAGLNSAVTDPFDVAGQNRILSIAVDIGAYEFQNPASVISYAWLQQYGLPTDGSADYTDLDGDGMSNWSEWVAGTIPTDALSSFRLLSAIPTNGGILVTWTSVTNRLYSLEGSTNLAAAPAFSILQSNIIGMDGNTSWTDPRQTGASLYRVRVQ